MSRMSKQEKESGSSISHSDDNMAHIYVIDCGINDDNYNICTENNDENDNVEFKLRVERNKQKPEETLVNGRDLEEVIKNTLIPPSSESITSPHTKSEERKMKYVLQFANGRVVLPNEMLRDGDAVEVHRYYLQRPMSATTNTRKSKQRKECEGVLRHHDGSETQQIGNVNNNSKRSNKVKSVILMSDESDDDDNDSKNYRKKEITKSETNGNSITSSSNDSDSNYSESTCANSKQMHTFKYIDALRQELAAARNSAQELDDEVENEKRILREQVIKASGAIRHDAELQLHSLHEQLANLEREAMRIRAMQNRTRCATKRILDKMQYAQTMIDRDIVQLDNEMHKMLHTWQKCVDAHLLSKYKQIDKISGKEYKSHELVTNERAELEAEGVILCRELIASVAHTCVCQMRQKMEHEWNNTREMETEQVGKTFSHIHSTLPESERNSSNNNCSETDYSIWPFSTHSTNIVKVIARLRPPCSSLDIFQEHTKTRRKIITFRQDNEVQDDFNNNNNNNNSSSSSSSKTRKVNNENNEIERKWNVAWTDLQTSNEYNEFVNETDASVHVRVPTKGVRTFKLNAVYGPILTNPFSTKQFECTTCLPSCNSSSNENNKWDKSNIQSTKAEKRKQQQEEELQEQQQKRIFAEQLLPLILELLFCDNKRFITVIAYGAKGSGKSYTLLGNVTNVSEQCSDKNEKISEEHKDEDVAHGSSSRYDNRRRASEEMAGGEAETHRGITAVDANWVVNMNENDQTRVNSHNSENTNVSAYSTAWQSVAQNTVNSYETMLTFKEQITRQLSGSAFEFQCCTTDGLLPQTLLFLNANLRSNREHSILLEHKYQIVEIGVSACTIEQTGVHDLFAKCTTNDNNNNNRHHEEFTPQKTHKNSDTYYSSSSPSMKSFTTKVNKQNISLESLNVTSISDIAAIMSKLQSVVVKCSRCETSTGKKKHIKVDAGKDDSFTFSTGETQNDHSTQGNTFQMEEEKEHGTTGYGSANDNHHLLIVVRCILSTHNNVNGMHVQQQHNLQHSESVTGSNKTTTTCKESESDTETKEVQMLFVEVAAGIESSNYSKNSKDAVVPKSTSKPQSTRTLTSIGNILYALNHNTSLYEKKHELQHGTEETCQTNKLLCHATSVGDKSSSKNSKHNKLIESNKTNTSLSLITEKASCTSLRTQSIFDEDPGKWWDVLQPSYGMTFTRVAPIIEQTQKVLAFYNNNSDIKTTPAILTPENAQQRTKTKDNTPFVHGLEAQSSDSKSGAHNLSATQRSILAQGYANDTLTQLIRDGLTGNSRVLLMACLKPCVPCEVELITEDAKPLTLPNPHTDNAIKEINEIVTLLFNIQAPQMLAEFISTLTIAKRIMA